MKPPITPHYHIERALRLMWMKSRERAWALKRDSYACVKCGKKKSEKRGYEQKIEVHHKKGDINWEAMIKEIRKELLCNPDELECLCPECHNQLTNNNENKRINI